MADRITHVVEYQYWYRTREGDWDFLPNSRNCVNEAQALLIADRLRNDKDIVKGTVKVVKLDEPFMAGSEYED